MKARPDINDTLRTQGADAVRARSDKARKYNGAGHDPSECANGAIEETPPATDVDEFGAATAGTTTSPSLSPLFHSRYVTQPSSSAAPGFLVPITYGAILASPPDGQVLVKAPTTFSKL